MNGKKKICKALGRYPDFVIGPRNDPYLLRWFVIPKNPIFNIYLHKFMRSDDDRALHDHPWPSVGMIIRGEYIEHVPDKTVLWDILDIQCTRWDKNRATKTILRKAWRPVFRSATFIHRIELLRTYDSHAEWMMNKSHESPVWTIFITGARIRDWGFWCPQGFRIWTKFVSLVEGGNEVGPGCE